MNFKTPPYDHFYDEKTGQHLGFIADGVVRNGQGEVIRRIVNGQVFDMAGKRLGSLSRVN